MCGFDFIGFSIAAPTVVDEKLDISDVTIFYYFLR
jgi:hypothetical protein